VLLDRIEKTGARVESATEPFDTATAGGEFGRDVMLAAAHFESRQKSEQWREAHDRRRKLGLTHGSSRRFGYLVGDDGRPAPDPATAPYLAAAFTDYLAGDGHLTIARRWNALGVHTSTGGQWRATNVARVLDSGFAAGRLHRAKTTGEHLPGAHPPLIDERTWTRYQAERQRRRDLAPRASAPVYPLSGLVRCGRCGGAGAMASGYRSGVSTPGYLINCATMHTARTCAGFSITRARAEREVLAWLAPLATDLERRATTKTARDQARADARADVDRLRKQIGKYEHTLANATRQVAEGTMREPEYRRLRDEVTAERERTAAELDRASLDAEAHRRPAARVARGLIADWTTLAPARQRQMLATLIRHVIIHPSPRPCSHGATVEVVPRWA
jgi:hypothetical protein